MPARHGIRSVTVAVVTAAVVLLTVPACGSLRHPFSSGGGVKTRTGTLVAAPPGGPVGTRFTLTAGGFRPGESMTFEIDIPPKQRFVGPPHPVGPDGTVTSTYTPQTGDPAGVYQVKAVGNQGTHAETSVTVTG